ncbi:hypothetical protein L3Q82_004533 [Scortum barcoo]|uniref:Uncharacterized protein n=1 Tax=Scortum barcoo TaxID=214431 RepID=A0ACB8VGQ3_9TELE|nr:hypothetical protein L3Q82_004533 [Scortum barcoo]
MQVGGSVERDDRVPEVVGTSSPTRPQVVRIGDNTSSTLVLSTGTPQGCVLSPALFTLFTSDCSAIHSTNTIVKFADDTTIVGLISDNDETHYREEIQHLTQWCSNNNLVLNTSITKGRHSGLQEVQEDRAHSSPSSMGKQLSEEPRANRTSIWSHKGSEDLISYLGYLWQSGYLWRAHGGLCAKVRPPKEMPPHTITDPLPNRSCWRMLQAAERSPRRLQTLSRLSHVLSVNLLSSVKSTGRQWTNLPILVFSGKCQTSCTVLGCKHNPHLWTSGPHTTLMESVSDRLSRHMHICGLLEVILQGSGSAPPVPPCTKAEVAVLLLGCCPPTAFLHGPAGQTAAPEDTGLAQRCPPDRGQEEAVCAEAEEGQTGRTASQAKG